MPSLKNEQSNYESKFAANQSQQQTAASMGSLSAAFGEQTANLAATLQGLTAGQAMNGTPMPNVKSQPVISPSNELAQSPNCQKTNTILSKFSSKPNELNKLQDLMEIKQIQKQQQATAVCLNSVVQSLKRSPVDSLMEMQQQHQQHSPLCNSESSSIKSSPGTSLSSSPTHYSTNGYSNVHMLRNSILNEPTISINQSQTSTIPLSTFLTNSGALGTLPNGNTFFQPDKEDSRPIAIVQGKKNRHNLNEDEDEAVGSIKKFCVNGGTNAGAGQLQQGGGGQLQQTGGLQQPSAQLDSSSPNEFRYLMQNAVQNTFGGLANGALSGGNLGNDPGNTPQQATNPNNPTSLACNQQQQRADHVLASGAAIGIQSEAQPNRQRTDPANLFSTACCTNAHEDCKPPASQQEYRCGQRHATADFRYFVPVLSRVPRRA